MKLHLNIHRRLMLLALVTMLPLGALLAWRAAGDRRVSQSRRRAG